MTDLTPASAAQELLKRRHALAGMPAFRTYMAATGSKEFEHAPARHHLLIVEKLEALARGDIQRLLILAPPGSAKSTYCSIQFPLWYLAQHPEQNILCASNSENLAENFNRRRRNLALTPQWCALASTTLAPDLQGVGHFGTAREGGIRAAGVGSSIIGFRSQLNILDDPITGVDQALSATQLDKQWDWYHSDFRTRLVPTGKELIVSTRWARRDIAGRILEHVERGNEEGWTVLRLPMLADSADDPLGRAERAPLWPGYYSAAYIAEKQQNPLLWSTQFQQVPLDEVGAWVSHKDITYEDEPSFADGKPAELHYVLAVDLALTVGAGDYSVIVVAGLDASRRLHICHVWRDRVGPDETAEQFYNLCDRYEPLEVLIDDDNASKVFARLLHVLGQRDGRRPPPLNPQPLRGKDKETRAAALRGLFLTDTVRIARAPWNTALHRELLEFPAGTHDDQIDALSLIGRRFPMLSAPAAVRVKRDPYEGFATRFDTDGRSYVNVGLEEMFADRETRRLRSRRI